VSIGLENYGRLSASEHDEGVWFHLLHRYGTAHAVLTREQVEQLIVGLQKILFAIDARNRLHEEIEEL
jgi:hypothetical protein